jgi:hypothetical protein
VFAVHRHADIAEILPLWVVDSKGDGGELGLHLVEPRIAVLGDHARTRAVSANEELLARLAELQLEAELLRVFVGDRASRLVESSSVSRDADRE